MVNMVSKSRWLYVTWLLGLMYCSLLTNKVTSSFHGFDAAFPKPFDTLTPRYCLNHRCYYHLMVAGWFWDGWLPSDIEQGLHIVITMQEYNFQQSFLVDSTYQHPTQGNIFLGLNTPFSVPNNTLLIKVQIDVVNSGNETVYSRSSLLQLLSEADSPHRTVDHISDYELFIHKYSQSTDQNNIHRRILDFIEIGTSDFETVIENVLLLRDRVNHSMLGISMDPVLRYQQSLPHLDSVFKLNAAINTKTQVNETATLYYLPDNVLQKIEYINPGFVNMTRGCFALNSVHPVAMQSLFDSRLPAYLLAKQSVKTYSIEQLWQWFVEPHFDRLRLLKLDVEGLDQQIISELLNYFIAKSELILPCMIEFEAYNDRDEGLFQRLQDLGYHLQHKVTEDADLLQSFSGHIETVLMELYHSEANVVAFHCSCSYTDLYIAYNLMYFDPFGNDQVDFMQFVCDHHSSPV